MSCNSASKAHLDRQSGLSSFLPGTRRMGRCVWGGGGRGRGRWCLVRSTALREGTLQCPGGAGGLLQARQSPEDEVWTSGDNRESTESGKRVWFLNQKDLSLNPNLTSYLLCGLGSCPGVLGYRGPRVL